MSFDSSRFTFDPWNNFSGVVMQQGRVQLDSDWNEWLAEFARRIRAGTLDTLGRAVVPLTTKTAFQIGLSQDASGNVSISIGPGRMYVDGLLAENHGLPAPNPQKWIPGGGAPPASSNAISRFTLSPAWDSALDELTGVVGVDYTRQPYYPNAERAGSVSPIRRSLPDLPGRMAAGRHLPGGSGPGRESRGSRYHGARANRVAGQVAGRERRARRELFHSRREPDGGLAESAAAPGTETDDRRGAVERRRSLLPDSEYRIHRSRKSTLPGGDPPARLCRHGNLQVVARQCLGGHRRQRDRAGRHRADRAEHREGQRASLFSQRLGGNHRRLAGTERAARRIAPGYRRRQCGQHRHVRNGRVPCQFSGGLYRPDRYLPPYAPDSLGPGRQGVPERWGHRLGGLERRGELRRYSGSARRHYAASGKRSHGDIWPGSQCQGFQERRLLGLRRTGHRRHGGVSVPGAAARHPSPLRPPGRDGTVER